MINQANESRQYVGKRHGGTDSEAKDGYRGICNSARTRARERGHQSTRKKGGLCPPQKKEKIPVIVNIGLPPFDNKKMSLRQRSSQKLRHHNSSSDRSVSSTESGGTATTHASSISSLHQEYQHDYDQRRDRRELLKNQRKLGKKDFYASDSQLNVARRTARHSAARNPLHASMPRLDYPILEEPETEYRRVSFQRQEQRKTAASMYYDPKPTESPLLLLKLSEQLGILEKRVEEMTSRQLMELSERIGVPVAYSCERGLELIDKEGSNLRKLTEQVQRVLEE